jgi:OOP family OmpA-OmpF porin
MSAFSKMNQQLGACMRRNTRNFHLIAVALILSLAGVTLAQNNLLSDPLLPMTPGNTRNVPEGQQLKINGIVVKRDADSFTLREPDGTETVVTLTDNTNVKTIRGGLFRKDRKSGVGYILRGLRLEAEGRGNAEGQLVAAKIRFEENDLRTAQALEARVEPVENVANSAKALSVSNEQRITVTEQNAEKLSGQLSELSAVAEAASAQAKQAQATGDNATSLANNANDRINGLDDYETVQSVSVHFRSGSAVLSDSAKAEIDEAAARVKSETLKGWVVEVVGYADSTGHSTFNRSLSERRAQNVIDYLVTKYNLPLRRLVQPFGYGSLNPVASNDTGEGRSLNRRVEIRVLVSKGLTSSASL